MRLARNFGAMQKHGERVLSPPIAEENSERREGSASKCRGAPRSSLTSGSTRFATRDAPSWPSSSRCTSCNLCGGRIPPDIFFNLDQESMTAWSKGPLPRGSERAKTGLPGQDGEVCCAMGSSSATVGRDGGSVRRRGVFCHVFAGGQRWRRGKEPDIKVGGGGGLARGRSRGGCDAREAAPECKIRIRGMADAVSSPQSATWRWWWWWCWREKCRQTPTPAAVVAGDAGAIPRGC